MNLNKALILSFCFLILLVIVTAINFKHPKNKPDQFIFADNSEMLMAHVRCVPEIVRSYETVKHVYGKKNILFFRYVNNSNSCSSCLDNQLNELFSLQEEIGKDYIWVFPAYPDNRSSRIQLSNELAKYNYRNIPADSLLIPIYGGEQKSYFAWVNNEGEIDMVFIPDRNNGQLTRNYFLEVKRMIQMSNR